MGSPSGKWPFTINLISRTLDSNSLIAEPMQDTARAMRTRYHLRRCTLLLCLLAAAIAARAQEQNGSPSLSSTNLTTISGRVVNASTGAPIARALVRFSDRAMLTGYDGKFEFDQVNDASGNLQASKPGFYASLEPGGSSGLYLGTSQATTGLELRLYPEAIFTGTVTASNGEPLSDILVSARRSMFNSSVHVWIPVAQVQTDAHGRFRLPVQAGDYKLVSAYTPHIRGEPQAALPVVIPAETSSGTSGFIHIRTGEEQHFDLHPVTSRAYTVTASSDTGTERDFPRITARTSNGSVISLPVHFSHNEGSGTIQVELPTGTYTLNASVRSPQGVEEGETNVTVSDHDVSGLIFHLVPVPVLPVELQIDEAATSDNSPPNLLQFGLMLVDDEADLDNFSFPVSLAQLSGGQMAFAAAPGSYRLRSRNNGGTWYIESASYGTSDLLQQEMVVAPGAGGIPIRIKVSNQTGSLQGTCKLGAVAAGCWVYLIPTTSSATTVFTGRGNEQGIYNFTHLPPGSYQAIAFEQMHSADYGDPAALASFSTHVRTVTVSAGEKPTLDLDTVTEAEMAP